MFNYNIWIAPFLFIRGETVDLTKPLEDEMEEKMDSHQEEQTNWIRSSISSLFKFSTLEFPYFTSISSSRRSILHFSSRGIGAYSALEITSLTFRFMMCQSVLINWNMSPQLMTYTMQVFKMTDLS